MRLQFYLMINYLKSVVLFQLLEENDSKSEDTILEILWIMFSILIANINSQELKLFGHD